MCVCGYILTKSDALAGWSHVNFILIEHNLEVNCEMIRRYYLQFVLGSNGKKMSPSSVSQAITLYISELMLHLSSASLPSLVVAS